jgi:hypothetical protein
MQVRVPLETVLKVLIALTPKSLLELSFDTSLTQGVVKMSHGVPDRITQQSASATTSAVSADSCVRFHGAVENIREVVKVRSEANRTDME